MFKKVLLALQVLMIALYASDDDADELSGTRIVKTDGSNNLKTFCFEPPSSIGEGKIAALLMISQPGPSARSADTGTKESAFLTVLPWSIDANCLKRHLELYLAVNGGEPLPLVSAKEDRPDHFISFVTEKAEQYFGRVMETNSDVVLEATRGADFYNVFVNGTSAVTLKGACENSSNTSSICSLALRPTGSVMMVGGVLDFKEPFFNGLYGNCTLGGGPQGFLLVGASVEMVVRGGVEIFPRALASNTSSNAVATKERTVEKSE